MPASRNEKVKSKKNEVLNMKFFILTDIEGAVGVESFTCTNTRDLELKGPAMKQLAREVNVCIEGIREVYPDSEIDVWDGHGTGGLFPEDVIGGRYLPGISKPKPYFDLKGFSAQLVVGQHAMAGTFHAPLCHTYSSQSVADFKLNGVFIGEFGARALIAGLQGVSTIFLSGDDKAALEAQTFIPQIETVTVKWGKGLEAAEHRDTEEALTLIKEGTSRAVRRLEEIPPFVGFQPPFSLEIRYYNQADLERWNGKEVQIIDEYTIKLTSNDLQNFPI
jgi:D-amino peptidase